MHVRWSFRKQKKSITNHQCRIFAKTLPFRNGTIQPFRKVPPPTLRRVSWISPGDPWPLPWDWTKSRLRLDETDPTSRKLKISAKKQLQNRWFWKLHRVLVMFDFPAIPRGGHFPKKNTCSVVGLFCWCVFLIEIRNIEIRERFFINSVEWARLIEGRCYFYPPEIGTTKCPKISTISHSKSMNLPSYEKIFGKNNHPSITTEFPSPPLLICFFFPPASIDPPTKRHQR